MQRPIPPLITYKKRGFTLIEISIVLVIIGLVIGGILVGHDLIKSSEVQAQISQIDKYNSAVNVFQLKYGFLPGDIPDPTASNFGFGPRGTSEGEGDGNGVLEGISYGDTDAEGVFQSAGETTMFWVDLSKAQLIDGSFSIATETNAIYTGATSIKPYTTPALKDFLPAAKLGNGNYIYAYSGYTSDMSSKDGINYFGLSQVSVIGYGMNSNTSLSVNQAYSIDKKIDDGLPQSGVVLAQYVNSTMVTWAGSGGELSGPYTNATPGSATTCFDNGDVDGQTQTYSVSQNSGTNPNCALSFKIINSGR